jgi:ribosome-associated protein
MLRVAPNLHLDETEIRFEFVAASGPGGQNVNKVASAAQLRFDALASPSLTLPQKERLRRLAGRRMSKDGVLVIQAQRFRSQEQNRRDALERLLALLREAASPPRPRHKTRPTRASVERRLTTKKQRSLHKQNRRGPREEG